MRWQNNNMPSQLLYRTGSNLILILLRVIRNILLFFETVTKLKLFILKNCLTQRKIVRLSGPQLRLEPGTVVLFDPSCYSPG